MRGWAELARGNGMEIVSCAEDMDFGRSACFPGKCVDDR